MALRTIADLPSLDIETISQSPVLKSNLDESLMEISYMETSDRYDTYKSKNFRFKQLTSIILQRFDSGDFDFHSYHTFYGGIGVSGVLNLSGDLLVNNDMTYEQWSQYTAIINAGDMRFTAVQMQLCAENLIAYTDHGQVKSYDGVTTYVDWDSTHFNVNLPLRAQSLSCGGLTSTGDAKFTGNATFTNVINGCALCAKWADLAELYKADADYAPGTLVKFGGEAEITVADSVANAVVTDRPGLVLNGAGERDGVYKGIALVGRTPVLAVGPVERFDRLVPSPSEPGAAVRASDKSQRAIGVTFGSVPAGEKALVECAVQLNL